ncbi:MAG: DUF2905 domain-containing protein [Deltaproteobacteria bacterium]|nr:DUF2905 domain-containing protein [Deltaproteobacteria bacterium]MDL1971704.1 DUF2905 domain-containing protein [Deltaproteobacteria bacterium]
MNLFSEMGKLLIIVGILFVAIGLLLTFAPNIPYLGRLPGDISIKRGNFHFYFPIVTCLLLSIIITILLNLFRR